MANAYSADGTRVQQDLSIAESQLRDYQARLGKPFLHEEYLFELSSLHDQLKAGLSSTAHEEDKEVPTISDLAEKIKALKAAHNVEATPQRARQKHSTAEEPVTARRRMRAGANPPSKPAKEADAAASPPEATDQNSSIKPEMTFQERIATQWQNKDQEPDLP